MIRFLFRLLGFLIVAGGFVALVIDGTRWIASDKVEFTSAATSWAAVSPETLERAQALFASVPGGEGAFAAIVAQPTCLVLGIFGLLLMLIGRRGRRPVGVVP